MASNSDDLVYIGSTALPPLLENGLTASREKIWSSNTGRAANGEMTGDIVAIKYTLKLRWPPLTRAQVAAIDALVSQAFFDVTFTDPATNARKTIKAYSGTPTYPVKIYIDEKPYQGVAVDIIGK